MRTVPGGHDFHEESDGSVDEFYLDAHYCNGPGCRDCGESWCEHCTHSDFPGSVGDSTHSHPLMGVYAEKCPAIIESDTERKELSK